MIGKLLQIKMVDKVVELITASLSLISALAWNNAFQKTINENPALKKYGPWIYALVITGVSVLIITSLTQIKKGVKNIIFENIIKIPQYIFIIVGLYLAYLIYTSFHNNSNELENNSKEKTKVKENNQNFADKLYYYL
tara:strand:- start:371 stop:784 length:414 start_codon:yes stop_codon:yes gene_type:complete